MSEIKTRAFLDDVLAATRRIALYAGNMRHEAFLEDLKTQDAVVRNLEIIEEATRQIPDGAG